jgi:hypothetical protein
VSRFVVVRERSGGEERLVEESSVPTEAVLHDVLRRNPELVPATDIGFGRMVTVGFETNLVSGAADLILMDDGGRLCLVEVKKQGNTDTRRVVAQVMDYAAALWGKTLEEFEREVLRPRLGQDDPRSLREFVVGELLQSSDDIEDAADRLLESLSETLRSGDFTLVVAAPEIPEGVVRVMEYLNGRGLTIYGLEVSFFAGDIEAFVPRIVVRPTIGARIAGRDSRADTRASIEPETYFDTLPDAVTDLVRAFIDEIPTIGAELQWRHYGPRIRVTGSAGPKVVASIQGDGAYIVTGPLRGIDPAPAERALARLQGLPGVGAKPGATYPGINIRNASREEVATFFEVARSFLTDLLDPDTR